MIDTATTGAMIVARSTARRRLHRAGAPSHPQERLPAACMGSPRLTGGHHRQSRRQSAAGPGARKASNVLHIIAGHRPGSGAGIAGPSGRWRSPVGDPVTPDWPAGDEVIRAAPFGHAEARPADRGRVIGRCQVVTRAAGIATTDLPGALHAASRARLDQNVPHCWPHHCDRWDVGGLSIARTRRPGSRSSSGGHADGASFAGACGFTGPAGGGWTRRSRRRGCCTCAAGSRAARAVALKCSSNNGNLDKGRAILCCSCWRGAAPQAGEASVAPTTTGPRVSGPSGPSSSWPISQWQAVNDIFSPRAPPAPGARRITAVRQVAQRAAARRAIMIRAPLTLIRASAEKRSPRETPATSAVQRRQTTIVDNLSRPSAAGGGLPDRRVSTTRVIRPLHLGRPSLRRHRTSLVQEMRRTAVRPCGWGSAPIQHGRRPPAPAAAIITR